MSTIHTLAEPGLDSEELTKRLTDLYMHRSRSERAEFYSDFRSICRSDSSLTTLSGATPLREAREWDDKEESEENDRLLAAKLADFAANFPHVPVCEAGVPSRATTLEMKVCLQTHGCFASSVES